MFSLFHSTMPARIRSVAAAAIESAGSHFATWFAGWITYTYPIAVCRAVVSVHEIKPMLAARGGEKRPFDD